MDHIRQHAGKVTLAEKKDVKGITRILNQAIEWGDANAYTRTFKKDDRIDWFTNNMKGKYAIYVYRIQGQVLGYLCINAYRSGRDAFGNTAEVSYYVDFDHHRDGIASTLMAKAFEHCRKKGIKNLLAFLYAHNEKSILFLKKFGFSEWGFFPGIAEAKGNVFDHVVYGKKII